MNDFTGAAIVFSRLMYLFQLKSDLDMPVDKECIRPYSYTTIKVVCRGRLSHMLDLGDISINAFQLKPI